MIKSTEVRIGNVILWNGKATKLSALHIYTMFDAQDEAEEGSPIQITPEILEKAGFETEANANDDGLNYIKDHFIIDCNFKMVFESAWASFITIELKHVHQLQNLYFALTGEELEISMLAPE